MLFSLSKTRLAYEHIEARKKLGESHANATNMSSIELGQAAEAHCRAFLVHSSYEMIKNINKKVSTSLATVLQQLLELYAVETCIKSLGDLLRVSLLRESALFFKCNSDLFLVCQFD